jgi:hypothetical protein
MGRAFDQVAMFAVPGAVLLVSAGLLFGPGALRPAAGMRVWGRAGASSTLALRLEGARRFLDIDDGVSLEGVRVRAFAQPPSGASASPHATADATMLGRVGEVVIDAPPGSYLEVRGRVAGDPTEYVLAAGALTLDVPPSEPAPPRSQPILRAKESGDGKLQAKLTVPRGVLASPFAERVLVQVEDAGRPVRGASVRLKGAGLRVRPDTALTDDLGAASVEVTPFAHVLDVSLEVRFGERTATANGLLPVQPSAIWLSPSVGSGGVLEVVSPSPSPVIFASLDHPSAGRSWGAVLEATRGDDGMLRAALQLPSSQVGDTLTLSTDVRESGPATTTWRMGAVASDAPAPAAGPMRLLLDGMPVATRLERERAFGARRLAFWLLAGTALFEALYLAGRVRRAATKQAAGDPELARLLGTAIDDARGRHLLLASLAALVMLAFGAMAGLVAIWR